jgi:hypothetical protein
VGLVFLEATDIVFAVDSVPAIFAFTNEPLIVFTSNIFAILGLRALYFMLAGAVEKFYLLKYGLGTVLVFVGLKMVWLNQLFDGKFPIGISLGIIATVIAASVVLSLVFPRKDHDPIVAAPLENLAHDDDHMKPVSTIANRGGPATKEKPLKAPPRKSKSPTRLLWKTVAFYLLLPGLSLMMAAALAD